VPDDITALYHVSSGHTDAAIIDLATASYLISTKGITNLRIAGETTFAIRLAMGTPIAEPMLGSIIQKGLAQITDAERKEIRNRWINASSGNIFTDWRFWAVVIGALFALCAAIFGNVLWNRTLRRQVALRTEELARETEALQELKEELQAQNEELAVNEEELRNQNDELMATEEMLRIQICEHDISQKMLHDSEERFRLIMESVAVIPWEFNIPENRWTYVGPQVTDLLGYSPEEWTTLEWWLGIIHPEDQAWVTAYCADLTSRGEEHSMEYRLMAKDGAIVWVNDLVTIEMLDGKPNIMRGIIVDITERKLNEERSAKQKALFEAIFSCIPDAIVYTNVDREVVGINPAFTSILGYDMNDLTGHTTSFFYESLEEYERQGRIRYNLTAAERALPYEVTYCKKDGSIFPGETLGTTIKDQNSTVIGYIGVIRDITERKQAGSNLRRLTALLDESQHIALVGGWEIDLTTNELYWTDETYRIHETSPEEYSPTLETAIAFYAPESLPIISQAVKNAIEDNKNFNLELKMITTKGRPILVHTTCKVIRENDKAVKIMGAFKDITEQKLLQDRLQQAQKMESVGRLAGGVAHDFNNLLTVILGGAHLALSELEPDQPLHEYVTQIQKAGEKSAELTQQLLAFARKQTIEPKVLDLNEIVSGMIKMLQRLIGENTQLTWQPANNLWPVKADPSQIDQILANLCVNARDSTADIGTITIQTGNSVVDEGYIIEHADVIPGEYVHISVCDNGCGMDKETMVHIFEPFFTTKGIGEGTGLGLATVYGAAKQNNGFVNVYSELGIGTTFTIYLPRYVGNTDQKSAKAQTQPAPRGLETILLVEDEAAILNMVKMLLGKQGYTVLAANTPKEAIRLASEQTGKIDLLITDVIMPEMNGKNLALSLMSKYPNLKCLFMSGYTADVIAQHGVLEEGTHFIHKPFSLPDLAVKVRKVLD